jgi:hypothetical membrane protein
VSARTFLLAGAISPILFYAVFLVDGATRPGYDAWRNFVSTLALGERGWLQTANFLVVGALITVGAIGLWRAGASRALIAGIALIGLGLVGAGAFPTDPDPNPLYPPGATVPAQPSDSAGLHVLASFIVFVLLGVVPLASGLRGRLRDGWSRYSAVSGLLSLVLFVWLISLANQTGPVLAGLEQRVMILVGFAWLVALFMRRRAAS